MSEGRVQATVAPMLPKHVCTVKRLEALVADGFKFEEQPDGSVYLYVDGALEQDPFESTWREVLEAMRVEAGMAELILEGAYTCTKMRPGEFGGFVHYFTKHGVQENNTRSMMESFAAENRLLFIEPEERNRNAARYMADFVNRGLLKPDIFAEEIVNNAHRTLQQLLMRMFWACIVAWAKAAKKGQFDMRNQATASLCAEIVDRVGTDQHFPYV